MCKWVDIVAAIVLISSDVATVAVLLELDNISLSQKEQSTALKAFNDRKDVFTPLPACFGMSLQLLRSGSN